jgi:hypothetical protein
MRLNEDRKGGKERITETSVRERCAYSSLIKYRSARAAAAAAAAAAAVPMENKRRGM